MVRDRMPLSITAVALLTLVGALAVTTLLYTAISRLEYDKMALSFQQRATERATAIQKGLAEAVEVLTVANQLFVAAAPVTREKFHAFTTPLLQRHPFIQAFNYHVALPHAGRAAFEAEMRRVVPDYVMRDMTQGAPQRASERDAYYVVKYIEPMRRNETAFGMDVAPNRMLAEALDQALVSGRVSATGLLTLAQDTKGQCGFMLLLPLYRPGMPIATPAQRRAALAGDTAAVILATNLVHQIMEGANLLSDKQLELTVYAGDRALPEQLIYRLGAQAGAEPANSAMPQWLRFGYQERYSRTFVAAGKPWHVQVKALPRPFLDDHLGSLSMAAGGILFSLLAALYVQSLARRSRRVHRLVEERTTDLKMSNEMLHQDVLVRQRTERALQESEKRFRRLLALSSDWYWEQDAHFRFTHITSGFADKSNMPLDSFIGQTRWDNNYDMRNSAWGREHIDRLHAHLPFSNLEYPMHDRDGALRWFSINGEPLFSEQGQFLGYRGTGSEITERKLAEQRIYHIAHHDVLTGLPNRALMRDRLGQAIAYANRSGHQLWVMLIDLDRFKFVNDSMGHKAGDLLLQTVASRLQQSLRTNDTVARMSGDEFVAILGEHPSEPLGLNIVHRLMQAVAQPVTLDGKEFSVTCSIGVAVYKSSDESQQTLIEQADIAMYCAKKLGRNNIQFYTPEMNQVALERVRIESALRNALARDEFVLHYQPQVDLGSGKVVGMEALLRWQHPELGMVAPARFIALAEETGLIVPIGAWVMRLACQQAKLWHDAGHVHLTMSVNLSARQFSEPNLTQVIATILAESGLAPACLELELTESLFMSDVTLAVRQLHEMKALGLKLSIDDFGTGYSSFAYLRSFPIDVLKIDRSFVSDIADAAADAAIVASIIALAHNLKLRVIAEGVETAQQMDYLRRHGCDEMQGYYFSRPLPAHECEALLLSNRALAVS